MDHTDIHYVVNRIEDASTRIYIDENDQFAIDVAPQITQDQVRALIVNHSDWINKKLASRVRKGNPVRNQSSVEIPSHLLYLGRRYPVQITEETEHDAKLIDHRLTIQGAMTHPDSVMQNIVRFFTRAAEKWIPRRVSACQRYVEWEPKTIEVTDTGQWWAKNSRIGDIRFHWKCAMAPPAIMDYIVVHAMIHIKHKEHDEAFWDAMNQAMPDHDERVIWLKDNATGMKL